MKAKISLRLQTLSHLVPKCNCFADIGTDHGYLPYLLLENEQINNAILCDINKGPLENARKTLANTPFSKSAHFKLGSGLLPIKDDSVDVVCIAGMGGGLIINILEESFTKAKDVHTLILQPQTEQNELRKWLIDQSFFIQYDYFISEADKYYEMIVVLPAHNNASSKVEVFDVPTDDLEFGKRVIRENLLNYQEFLLFKHEKYSKIKNAIHNKSTLNQKLKTVDIKLETINELLTWIETITGGIL